MQLMRKKKILYAPSENKCTRDDSGDAV